MELWIRGQDKDFLIKVDNINLGYQNDENNKKINEARRLFTFAKDTSFTLGVYKTEERALEVLDDIQRYINNSCKRFIDTGVYHTSKYEYRVYEMPKE